MANQWFRMYHEFLIDSKVQKLSEAMQRRYIMILCMRCCNGDVTLHDDDVTFQLRISDEEWKETKAVFLSKNLIDKDNKPTNWDKRQFVSDSSKSRVYKHRELKKQSCNVTVTTMKRPQITDTDTDTDKKIISLSNDKDIVNTPPEGGELTIDSAEKPTKKKKLDNCPYNEIVNLYHSCLPSLSTIQAINEKRKRQIKNLWTTHLKTLTEWENYFKFVGKSDFLMGKTTSHNMPPFKCSIDFITNENNFLKISEDKYHG